MQAFEGMFSGMKSKSEALELENVRLKEAICLPDLQVLFGVWYTLFGGIHNVRTDVCVCTNIPSGCGE